ncbi:MAG: glycosyltransferase family 4 protein [Gammaproteobacteria bacterium]|nr:glycosyltransferase family 4 protein [Gammaproteobacteria bacterium]
MPRVLCVTDFSDRAEAACLAGLPGQGFEISVMCPRQAPSWQTFAAAGLHTIDLRIKGNIDRHAIQAIREELQRVNYDIVHTFNNRAITNALLATRNIDIRIVAYRGIVGNVSFLDPMSWLRYLHPRVDRIVCVANAVRDYFLDMGLPGLRVDRQKPVTIYKGHDLDWYRDEPADLALLGIPASAFVICCVANDRPRKGLPVLIDALDQLPAAVDTWLLLVGKMDSPRLQKKIAASPRRNRIVMAGYREDAPTLAAASDCLVLPALRREGLPKVVIEAMAYATVPIVTDSGGSPELVVDGESGLVVPPGEAAAIAAAIEKLHDDTDLCRTMGKAAQARIRKSFRVEDTIMQTAALYRELLA